MVERKLGLVWWKKVVRFYLDEEEKVLVVGFMMKRLSVVLSLVNLFLSYL